MLAMLVMMIRMLVMVILVVVMVMAMVTLGDCTSLCCEVRCDDLHTAFVRDWERPARRKCIGCDASRGGCHRCWVVGANSYLWFHHEVIYDEA